ncbi:tripartite motif-containing protein 50/73/74 [Pelomyxa schiedti]|nr:tripartite motif-containing protein 50/73/74 [Pelomyxa schiedti]
MAATTSCSSNNIGCGASMSVGELIASIMPNKPLDKRESWAEVLKSQEYETVDDLAHATSEAWNALALPLAVKSKLKAACCLAPQLLPARPVVLSLGSSLCLQGDHMAWNEQLIPLDTQNFELSSDFKFITIKCGGLYRFDVKVLNNQTNLYPLLSVNGKIAMHFYGASPGGMHNDATLNLILQMAGVTNPTSSNNHVAHPPPPAPPRCCSCRDPLRRPATTPLACGPVVVPSCGHPVCRACSGAIATFSRDIPRSAAAAPSASPPGPPPRAPVPVAVWCGLCRLTRDATLAYDGVPVAVWCGLCRLTRDATLAYDGGDDEDRDGDGDGEAEQATCCGGGGGTEPNGAADADAAAPGDGDAPWCSTCQAMGMAEVRAVYVCVECTKASGGGAPLMFCESCWSKAHWAPWLMSHAKADASSIPQEPSKTRICEKHRLQLDLFCETDGKFICPTCSFLSSHKGHTIVAVEELCDKKKSSCESLVSQISKLQTDLKSCAKSVESVTSNVKKVHSEFEEKVCREFNEMISRLQRRQEELLSLSRSIASSKVSVLSVQLESITAGIMHIEQFQSKFESILRGSDPFSIIEFSDYIAGFAKQIECKPEHLTPCVTATLSCCTDDIEPFKSMIPDLCFISSGPVLECIKEETTADARRTGGRSVTLCGQWTPRAKNRDIQVRVGESECTNVNIVTPGSVLTFTLPDCGVGCDLPVTLSVFGAPAHRPNDTRFSFPGPEIQNLTQVPRQGGRVTITGRGFGTSPREITVCVDGVMCLNVEVTHPHTVITCTVPPPQARDNQATLTLTVAGQHVSSTLLFEIMWEWDTGCCGNLVIPPDDKSKVFKPVSCRLEHVQSTVTATTQLSDPDRVYEWHLSISDLKDGYHWVAYGLIQRPFDQNDGSPYNLMYCWNTNSFSWRIPGSTPTFKASGGTEHVMFRYDARTLTLTATWPLHNNATATVNDIPRGLYPAVEVYNHNTVKITKN